MLRLPARLLAAVIDHCRAEHPVEACGVLAGPTGGDPDEVIRMTNTLASTTRYGFDPAEQLSMWRQLADMNRAPLVIYHSHTASGATMSRLDVDAAREPGAHYLVVSTERENTVMRAWQVVDGVAVESVVEVVR